VRRKRERRERRERRETFNNERNREYERIHEVTRAEVTHVSVLLFDSPVLLIVE
jgi:hypothetical protein